MELLFRLSHPFSASSSSYAWNFGLANQSESRQGTPFSLASILFSLLSRLKDLCRRLSTLFNFNNLKNQPFLLYAIHLGKNLPTFLYHTSVIHHLNLLQWHCYPITSTRKEPL